MGKKKNTETTTNVVNVPSWLDDKNKALISRVDQLSQAPYEAYTGERVAGFTPDQLAAFNLVRSGGTDAANRGMVANQGVMDLYNRAQGPTTEDIQGLMNPYLEQVLGLTKRQEAESQAEAMSRLKQESALAGSFGGSRFALEKSLQDDQNQRRLSDIDYTGRFDAYNNALNQYNQGSNVLSEAIGRSIDVSNNDPQTKYAQALLGIGGQQQAQDQTNIDVNYQDFLTEQQYPYQQAQWAQSFLQPYTETYKGNTTTKTSRESGGGLQQAIGAGIGIAGMFATGGALNPATVGGLGAMMGLGGLGGSSTPTTFASGLPYPQNKPATPAGFRYKDGGAVEGYANGGGVSAADEEFLKKREAIRANNVAALMAPASALPNDITGNVGYVSDPDAVIAPDEITNAPVSMDNGVEDLSYLLDTPRVTSPTVNPDVQAVVDPKGSAAQRVKDEIARRDADRAALAATPVAAAPAVGTAPSTQSATNAVTAMTDNSMPSLAMTDEYIKQLIGKTKEPVGDSNYQKYNFLGYEGQVYLPLFKAGLAMMSSDGDFFEALAAGGNAFAGQLESSSKTKAEKEAEKLKAFADAAEAERQAMQTQSNRIQVNKMNTEKALTPLEAAIKKAEATKNLAMARKYASDAAINDLYTSSKQ